MPLAIPSSIKRLVSRRVGEAGQLGGGVDDLAGDHGQGQGALSRGQGIEKALEAELGHGAQDGGDMTVGMGALDACTRALASNLTNSFGKADGIPSSGKIPIDQSHPALPGINALKLGSRVSSQQNPPCFPGNPVAPGVTTCGRAKSDASCLVYPSNRQVSYSRSGRELPRAVAQLTAQGPVNINVHYFQILDGVHPPEEQRDLVTDTVG